MRSCKRYKPASDGPSIHRANPGGGCAGCVYFSRYNCGFHGLTSMGYSAPEGSLQMNQII